jgi:hypothetical protein
VQVVFREILSVLAMRIEKRSYLLKFRQTLIPFIKSLIDWINIVRERFQLSRTVYLLDYLIDDNRN